MSGYVCRRSGRVESIATPIMQCTATAFITPCAPCSMKSAIFPTPSIVGEFVCSETNGRARAMSLDGICSVASWRIWGSIFWKRRFVAADAISLLSFFFECVC